LVHQWIRSAIRDSYFWNFRHVRYYC
jgi:hypothetical protein